MTRRQFAGGLAAMLACLRASPAAASPRPISFGVFSLFEPAELSLNSDHPLLFNIDGRQVSLSSQAAPVFLRCESDAIRITFDLNTLTAARLQATAPPGNIPCFTLAVPQTQSHVGIRRRFEGRLEVQAHAGRLQAVVSMDTETAVASIVAAESLVHASPAYLMAQAIASRSFLLAARTAHSGFDFCDTTHCQFLREPAAAGSEADLAAVRTRRLCLYYEGRPFAAMYSRSCSGQTSSLQQLGLPVRDYPYYSVICEFCLHHPHVWTHEMEGADPPHGERARLSFDRIHGWSAIPSGSFTRQGTRIEGRGIGHGLGLCQRGAIAMAAGGAGFDAIPAHYYPNTTIGPASFDRDLSMR